MKLKSILLNTASKLGVCTLLAATLLQGAITTHAQELPQVPEASGAVEMIKIDYWFNENCKPIQKPILSCKPGQVIIIGGTMTPGNGPICKPEIDRPEVDNKPEIDRPEIDRPEIDRPEIDRPEIDKPEVDKPEIDRPEIDKPEVDKPEVDKPETDARAAYENKVLELVNVERAKAGLQALQMDESVRDVARIKSEDMQQKGYFDHNSPTYGSPFDMLKQFGITYRSAGENIAQGYPTPEAVVKGWMNSEGHRANILSSKFTHIGVGYHANGSYWTQLFIGK